jgi:hypothetical protein
MIGPFEVQFSNNWHHRFLCPGLGCPPVTVDVRHRSMPIVGTLVSALPPIASYNPVSLVNSTRNRAVDMRVIVMAICARAVHELCLPQCCLPGHG